MELNPKLHIEVHDGVYPPSDDSYLLIQSLEMRKGKRVLDMGCGSGIVALHMAQQGCDVTAVDINMSAVKNTVANAEQNGFVVRGVQSDLFANLNGTRFDVITFNPPYLPTSDEDVAWDGGPRGTQIIAAFLREACDFLNKNGRIYMVMSSFTDRISVMQEFETSYSFEMIAQTHIFFETLYVYRITQK